VQFVYVSALVAFFFPDHITLIDLSKNLPFFFNAQTNPVKMLCVFFSDQISQIDLIFLGAKRPSV